MGNLYSYSLKDLEYWADRIERVAMDFGIDFYPQEFELVDHKTMLERQTYLGMLSFYPNWSSGKTHEIKSIFYELGLDYLPYELVVATNPTLACLMVSNDLAMQILTEAHVYGHNNFFKNNIYFKQFVNPELVPVFFKSSSEMIRSYEGCPDIGPQAVRKCIDAAHGLRWQCVNFDLLSFLRDNSPRGISDWEKFIINVILRAFNYLIRTQLSTIGMNEGWATYCHYKIVNALNLPQELRGAFARHHSKVVRLPDSPTAYNHYLVNFSVWNNLEKNYQPSTKSNADTGQTIIVPISSQLIEIMKTENDVEFLKKYLTREVAIEVGLFSSREREGNIVVDRVVADTKSRGDRSREDFEDIKSKLIETIKNSGVAGIPIISVADVNHKAEKILYLKHEFNGSYLDPEYTSKTLEYVHYFWGYPVVLETVTYKRRLPYVYEYDGRKHTSYRKR